MQKSLTNKLNRFNPDRPYVWELKVTEDEFLSLENDLRSYAPDASKKDDALKILVYLAEWYKRRYTNRAKKAYQETFGDIKPDLKTVWGTLGIDKRFLYEGEGRQKFYLYSTFVLGGLSVHFELQKNEKPFLKSLCRVLNGEDDSFEIIVDASHSIAFRESVKQNHCLSVYLKTIVEHYNNPEKLPFALEDYKLAGTKIKELVDLIKSINDAVKKSKFRLEWIVNAPYGDNLITRSLHLWLNPNKGDATKRHVYSNEDIQGMWGVPQSENLHYIRIGLRFIRKIGKEEIIVQDANPKKPAITFRNTGDPEIGFIASETDYAIVRRVPVQDFNLLEIVCWDDYDNCYSITKEDACFDAMQLFRMEQFEDLWTSRSLPKRESIVLFSDKYSICESSDDNDVEIKTLYNKYYGEGMRLNWCPVNIAVIIQDANGNVIAPFVNRQGINRIFIHLYKETIQYTRDGKVEWHKKNRDDNSETIDFVSFVAKKEDILAYFTQKQGEGEDDKIEIVSPDSIQYKGDNGRYIEWDETREPSMGINYIKVYSRHKLINPNDKAFPIFYLPGGIVRDCDEHTVKNGDTLLLDDSNNIKECIGRRQMLSPTRRLLIKTDKSDAIEVFVYRPVKLKEIIYDGKILMYDDKGEVSIPYILKEYIDINDFGEHGYHSYSCKDFRNVFAELSTSEYRLGGKYTSAIDGMTFSDEHAPEGVKFFVRRPFSKNPQLRYCYWDYKKGSKPIPVRDIESFCLPCGSVLFQDQRRVSHRLQCEYMEKDAKGFANIKKKGQENEDSPFEVFSVASEYNQYFFHFKVLRTLANGIVEGRRDFYDEIYYPFLKYHDNVFSMRDKKELLRFADEFCLYELKEQLITKLTNIV